MTLHDKVAAMERGERVIMSDADLELLTFSPIATMIRSAFNRNRCGVLDAYVCWTRDDSTPPDLEFRDNMTAWASK